MATAPSQGIRPREQIDGHGHWCSLVVVYLDEVRSGRTIVTATVRGEGTRQHLSGHVDLACMAASLARGGPSPSAVSSPCHQTCHTCSPRHGTACFLGRGPRNVGSGRGLGTLDCGFPSVDPVISLYSGRRRTSGTAATGNPRSWVLHDSYYSSPRITLLHIHI